MKNRKRISFMDSVTTPKTPDWADTTTRLDAGELLAHVTEVGRVPLLADGTDYLVVRVVQRLHAANAEKTTDYTPGVAAVDVRRVENGKNTEPGLMTARRASELAALLIKAAELAARVGGGR